MHVEVASAVAARQLRVRPAGPRAGRQVVDGPVEPAHRPQPEREVPAPVAARRPPTAADRQVDRPPRAPQLLGDLAARLAAADHQHRPGRQGRRVAVGVGDDLRDVGRQVRRAGRDERPLEGTGGDHDLGRRVCRPSVRTRKPAPFGPRSTAVTRTPSRTGAPNDRA